MQIDREINRIAFRLSSSFTTTEQYSERIAADTAPTRRSLSHCFLTHPEILEFMHQKQGLSTYLQRESYIFFWLGTMTLDLEVLILITAASYWSANHPSAQWRSTSPWPHHPWKHRCNCGSLTGHLRIRDWSRNSVQENNEQHRWPSALGTCPLTAGNVNKLLLWVRGTVRVLKWDF